MTNGFGGITSFMFLRTVFLKKAGEKKKSAKYLKVLDQVIKMGFLGGSLASILRGLFIAFIFNHVCKKYHGSCKLLFRDSTPKNGAGAVSISQNVQ